MTLYKVFFSDPTDDTERAAILLHESYHLLGGGERYAYKEVWQNKEQLGYTKDKYGRTSVWADIEAVTRQEAPELFK